MALPENFGSFEHLQNVYRQQFNRQVRNYFQDLGETWEPEVNTPRGSLRVACTMTDEDSALVMELRHRLLYDVLGYGRSDLAVVYGSRFDTSPPVAGHPQLFLVFSQDAAATPIEEPSIVHEKSVRLMKFSCAAGDDDGSSDTAITKANMTEIANEIKANFISSSRGITYTCGNKSASYTDPENGFAKGNYMLVNSRADATEIYQKLCNVIDVPFKTEKLIVNDPDKASTTTATAGTVTILGKQRKKRRYRPVAILRFRSAYISLGTLIPPIFLIDTTMRNKGLVSYP
ncbi:hypothetical protein LC593_35670 [Nostoc sp. CHAB 5844]|nr:hypothetical protein [Nostoc sp. CHAB 5844]